jgi:hypothetical protein
MLEKKYKNEYDDTYKPIRKIIANYITLIINCPENFEVCLNRKNIQTEFFKYIQETDEDELIMLLTDIYDTTKIDYSFLSSVFCILFSVIHEENSKILRENQQSPFEQLTKNLKLLLGLFGNCPDIIEAFVNDVNFLPNNLQNGDDFQKRTYLSPYINISLMDCPLDFLKSIFTVHKNQMDIDSILKYRIKKQNDLLDLVTKMIYILFEHSENSRQTLKNWIYSFIKMNMDKIKIYQKNEFLSKNGFTANILFVILNIIFEQEQYLELKHPNELLFYFAKDIEINFSLSNNRIDFGKFERINTESVKEILTNIGGEEQNFVEYNLNTELFFITNTLFEFLIKNVDTQFGQLSSELGNMNETDNGSHAYRNDPK